MKRLFTTLMILFTGLSSVWAQTATTSFTVGGIKVIFKPTSKNVINIRMYYRGGVTNYPASQAGIEDLALDATTLGGTKKYSPNAFKDTAGKYDVRLYGRSDYDYGYIQANCLAMYFDKGWDLFTEAVLNPIFDADEIAKIRNRALTAIKSANSDSQYQLYKLQMQGAFAHTPYELSPLGEEQTVAAITAENVKSYYKTLLNKNRMFIVVVGNINKDDLYQKVLEAFSDLPATAYSPVDLVPPVWTDNKLTSNKNSNLPIDYVSAIMPAPAFTSNDYVPFRLAITGLGGNLYTNLRSSGKLSYDPGTQTDALKMPFASMSASSSNPKAVMTIMMKTLKSIQTDGYDEEWLQHIKNSYITNSYINDQSADKITNSLGLAEILGNWQYADDLPQLVNFVTVEQVNRAIGLYVTGLRWTYIGKPDDISGFTPPTY